MLFSGTAMLAFALAIVGLYSVVSYSAAQRTSELRHSHCPRRAASKRALERLRDNNTKSVGSGLAAGILLSTGMNKLATRWIGTSWHSSLIILGTALLMISTSTLSAIGRTNAHRRKQGPARQNPAKQRHSKILETLTPPTDSANILNGRLPAIPRPKRLRIGFRVSILASGSSGNCTLLETERTCLLVDAGINRKELGRRLECLGIKPGRLDGILISHEHTDHTNGLAQISHEWSATAYVTKSTHQEIKKYLPEPAAKKLSRVEHIRAGDVFTIGDIEVSAFAIPHDAADPVGYTFRTNGTKVAIVTDLGYLPELVKHHLREADCLILESNHDLEMLKVGPYPWYIKQRVMSRTGHLSNTVVSDFLADPEVFDARARYLVLAHLSQQNNTPDLARISAEEGLNRRPQEAAFRGELMLASQHRPVGPLIL